MGNPELARWLRQQRHQRDWSQSRLAREIIAAALASGDHDICGDGSMVHNVYRWERRGDGPTDRYRPHVARALGIPLWQFGPGPHEAPPPESQRTQAAQTIVLALPAGSPAALTGTVVAAAPGGLAGPLLSAPANLAYGGSEAPEMGTTHVRREVLMAAHESSDHAENIGQPGIGETTFEQLRADLIRLAGEYDTGEPFPVFLEMRRVRDRIHRLLELRLWPREQTDLYFMIACLDGLMGSQAFRLGYLDAAEEFVRAGFAYAAAIGHGPLQGDLRRRQARFAYERGRIKDTIALCANGLGYVSTGPGAAFELHQQQARAAAQMGDDGQARQAVDAARDAFNAGHTDDLVDIGGAFVCSTATHHYCVGAALARVAEASREAEAEFTQAVDLYSSGSGTGPTHAFTSKANTRIELALIRLRSGALDAATDTLTAVLDLPPAQRATEIMTRLARVQSELRKPIFRSSPQARALDESIDEFGQETISAGLHSLSGGPG
jgi:transcriptional regulator with XRE-family HTH domain/tetratricopeptide (TPR) repeat protein